MPEPSLPTYKTLLWPCLQSIADDLHGSGKKAEIVQAVIERAALTDDQLAVNYPATASSRGSKILHRIAFALSSLKAIGALDNATRGVWVLTVEGRRFVERGEADVMEADQRHRRVLTERRANSPTRLAERTPDPPSEETGDSPVSDDDGWKRHLLDVVTSMSPTAFERLCVLLVRAAGCADVRATPPSGDGGVDGTGVLQVGLLSFPIYFQAKKYLGPVGPEKIREFRGALAGRANQGIFITSGTFTKGSKEEADRAGAPIDLIDGDRLCELLRQNGIGVSEQPVVDIAFFENLEG